MVLLWTRLCDMATIWHLLQHRSEAVVSGLSKFLNCHGILCCWYIVAFPTENLMYFKEYKAPGIC